MNNWQSCFLRSLFRRGYKKKELRTIMPDIRPFFNYLRTRAITDITPEHVRAYVALVKAACLDPTSFNAVAATNDKICAVKMFCIQMYVADKLPRDYAQDIGFLLRQKPESL